MVDLREEDAAGGRRHVQQRDARARQMPTHYGSGGKATWKDKYVSIYLLMLSFCYKSSTISVPLINYSCLLCQYNITMRPG